MSSTEQIRIGVFGTGRIAQALGRLLSDSGETAGVDKFPSLTLRFRPLRQKKIYQFQAAPQGLGTNGLLRIAHSDYIKIVEEL